MALDNPIFALQLFRVFRLHQSVGQKTPVLLAAQLGRKVTPPQFLGDITAFVPPTHRTFWLGGHSYTIIADVVLSFVALLMLPRPQEMILYGDRCHTHSMTTFGIIVRPGDMATIILSEQDGN